MSPPYLKIALDNPKPTVIDNLTSNNSLHSNITSHTSDQPSRVPPASLLPSMFTTAGTEREPLALLFDTDKVRGLKQGKRWHKTISKAQELSEKRFITMTSASNALVKASMEPREETLQAEKQLDEVHERVLEKLTSLSDSVALGDRHLNSSCKLLPRIDAIARAT